jgi:hypothetical protein
MVMLADEKALLILRFRLFAVVYLRTWIVARELNRELLKRAG